METIGSWIVTFARWLDTRPGVHFSVGFWIGEIVTLAVLTLITVIDRDPEARARFYCRFRKTVRVAKWVGIGLAAVVCFLIFGATLAGI